VSQSVVKGGGPRQRPNKHEKENVRLMQMLMLYCEEGNYDEVFNLVESKLGNPTPSDAHHSAADHFDIDNQSINDNGLTPLAMAIKHHHLQIAEYLITRGARVNSVNKVSLMVKLSYLEIDEAVNPV